MNNSYILATGKKALKRLEYQAKIGMELSLDHLKKAGIKEGMTVIDMGCGVGAMTVKLAELVGNNGKVYAIDINQEQLELAKSKITENKVKNVEFIQGDILSIREELINKVDIVYIRFVLMHLTRPEDAISVIKKYLKPNGTIASQESILETFNLISDHSKIVNALGKLKNVDYNIGNRTEILFKKQGFLKVEADYKQLRVSYNVLKELLFMSIDEWKDKAIEASVIDNNKLLQWYEEIENTPKELEYSLAKQCYVCASN